MSPACFLVAEENAWMDGKYKKPCLRLSTLLRACMSLHVRHVCEHVPSHSR